MEKDTAQRRAVIDTRIWDTDSIDIKLRLLRPVELTGDRRYNIADLDRTPGVILSVPQNSSLRAIPNVLTGRIDTAAALDFAAALDTLTDGIREPHCGGPPTFRELIWRWHELLGERLGDAIAHNQGRQAELRELRAALTGQITR